MSTASPPEAPARTPWARVPIIAVVLSLVVGVVLLAFAWPAVTAEPRDLPVGLVGTGEQADGIADAVAEQAEGAIALIRYDDRDAAVAAIERREAYGAIVLGTQPTDAPEVLIATAASPQAAQLMDGLARQLQARIDEQLRTALETRLAQAQAAAAEQVQAAVQAALSGQPPAGPAPGATEPIRIPSVTVAVTDVVPLSDRDPRGTGLTAAMFPLVMGGMIGGIGLTLLVAGARRRAVGLVVYAASAGLVLAGVLQGLFGALQGDYWVNAAAIALAIGAIGATITGLAGLIGRAGIGVGAAFTMLVANPISAATIPVEFIAAPWGAIGQRLPPGRRGHAHPRPLLLPRGRCRRGVGAARRVDARRARAHPRRPPRTPGAAPGLNSRPGGGCGAVRRGLRRCRGGRARPRARGRPGSSGP